MTEYHFEEIAVSLIIIAAILVACFILCISCCLTIFTSIVLAFKERRRDNVIMNRKIQDSFGRGNSLNTHVGPRVVLVPRDNPSRTSALLMSDDEVERIKSIYSYDTESV